jgi:hypothetical protein
MSTAELAFVEIPTTALATWLEQQGADRWWSIDGDPILTGQLNFPCPGDELAEELRKIKGTVEVKVPIRSSHLSKPEEILNAAVRELGENVKTSSANEPAWIHDRLIDLRWKDSSNEWLLVEDEETSENYRRDAAEEGSI